MSFGSRNSISFCLFSRVLGVLMLLRRMIRQNGLELGQVQSRIGAKGLTY